jgi:hypothetical protein
MAVHGDLRFFLTLSGLGLILVGLVLCSASFGPCGAGFLTLVPGVTGFGLGIGCITAAMKSRVWE